MEAFPQRIHCLGVGGIGVSGLAALLRARGCEVSGCDASPSPAMRDWLAARGIAVREGHSPAHLVEFRPDFVVRTPAVPDAHPELAAARAAGIPVASRGEVLARIVNASRGVAVCGTHGKTTTACFAVALLRALGGDGTGWCIGGFSRGMGGVARPPDPGAPLVVEADESDGTLALYRPCVTVVTSVDADHLEHFGSFDALLDCFRRVCAATSGTVAYCADDAGAARVAAAVPGAMGYGFSAGARLRAANLETVPDGSSTFDVILDGAPLGRATLAVPGRHNVLNALGAFGACLALGHAPADALSALGALRELPGRRFERHVAAARFEIVSDYSHHPAEIRALVETALSRPHRRLAAVFQPHRFSRTKALAADFPPAFRGVGELLLLPVYAASEPPLRGGTSADLYRAFRLANADDPSLPVPRLATGLEAAAAYLSGPAGLGPEDVLLVVGAGSVVSLVDALERPPDVAPSAGAPAPGRFSLSYGIEATADALVDVADEDALARALADAGRGGVRVLGQGTNLLVTDLGVRGRVIRLGGLNAFARTGDETVAVGCGLPGAALLARLRDAGLSGLECMAGIPGTVGGWLAMNAGTRFGAVGDCVEEVVAYAPGGARTVARAAECGFGYRRCAFLAGKVAARVHLRLRRDDPAAIAARMADFRAKRFDFSGLRTAGSVFKNPEGTSAGRLLDEAGCKGLRVGGAFVSDRHANIVAAGDGATASDILALIGIMHDAVLERSGVDLEREIRVW